MDKNKARFLASQTKAGNDNASGSNTVKKHKLAWFRMQKELNDLHLPELCDIEFPKPDNLLHFLLLLKPSEGYYKSGRFVFDVHVPFEYPTDPPRVKCQTKILHPNIDLNGNICLSILKNGWKPNLNINAVVFNLLQLLIEPNGASPLNREAADLLQLAPKVFRQKVIKTIRGGVVDGVIYPGCSFHRDTYILNRQKSKFK